MENVQAYIESGILELYVLGDISPEERLQVEEMAANHSEVKAEIGEIELSMEAFAETHAVETSELVKTKILNSLLVNLGDDKTFTKPRKHNSEEVFEDEVDNVIALPARRSNFYKYAFAACLTLLLISVYGIVNLYSKLQESSTQLTAMQLDKQKIANQVNVMDDELDIYRDTSYKVLKLKGVAKSPQSAMTLAWSPVTKKVVLDMHSVKLPAHDKQHQYQLWALVGGKPVDMGVFDLNTDTASVKQMKSIAMADAFAVTLEPAGGSAGPTLDQMVVMGGTK
ncbi:anti-sigma factor [Mucilaginibacter glaciei]|uniref:Anti-sigma factor n=1 Tax=Mucilaginibacter glaciei TaxID=2772109 RepID=A0A926S1K3_9SPHI|nr:anti-sigma factor [Mucilaginibacter glaciei]MBD1394135.1 anti-sigma factor [Mucilaginibacter glaciei]